MNAAARATAVALVTAVGVAGCTGSDSTGMRAEDPAIGANPGSSAALYLRLANEGGADDSLTGASCDCAEATSLHLTEDRNGILLMVGADDLEVPSESTVELHPGGSHIMLEGLRDPLEAGSTLEVRLVFDKSAPLTLVVPVVPLEDLADRVPEQ